ncbi:MAG TPA: hypothetical protein VE444_09845 [Gaiellaceae bacterium]|jgi:hypothetical protein|nr:hypothetical protein [Gaiellaceae bacterium]
MEARRRRAPRAVPRSGEARLRPLAEVVALPSRSPIAPTLAQALGAASRRHLLHTDLAPVPVRPTTTTTEAGAYRYVKRDPIDLRVSRRTGHAVVAFLHELGHFVDHQLGYDDEKRAFASAWHPAFAEWRTAVSAAVRIWDAALARPFYAQRELWARSYAQAVLLRSGDEELEAHLDDLQRTGDRFVWPRDQFAPVADAVDRVFARLDLAA